MSTFTAWSRSTFHSAILQNKPRFDLVLKDRTEESRLRKYEAKISTKQPGLIRMKARVINPEHA